MTETPECNCFAFPSRPLCVACYFRDDPSFSISFVCVSFFSPSISTSVIQRHRFFVIVCDMAHPQRVLAGFLIGYSALTVANVSITSRRIFPVGTSMLGRQLAQWPTDVSRQNIKGAAGGWRSAPHRLTHCHHYDWHLSLASRNCLSSFVNCIISRCDCSALRSA